MHVQSILDISNSDFRILRSSKRLSESKYILNAFLNNNLALDTFYKSKLREMQINLLFG